MALPLVTLKPFFFFKERVFYSVALVGLDLMMYAPLASNIQEGTHLPLLLPLVCWD